MVLTKMNNERKHLQSTKEKSNTILHVKFEDNFKVSTQ